MFKKISYILMGALTIVGCGATPENVYWNGTGGETSSAGGSSSVNDGGPDNSGGNISTGGIVNTGGTTQDKGGNKPTAGGSSSTGGNVNIGGKPVNSGGITSTGGIQNNTGGSTCVPKTCQEFADTVPAYSQGPLTACGLIDNGCGGTLDCGNSCADEYSDFNSGYARCGSAFAFIDDGTPVIPGDYYTVASQLHWLSNKNICGSSCIEITSADTTNNLCLKEKPDGPNTKMNMVVCSSNVSGIPHSNPPHTGCGPVHGIFDMKWEYSCCD